MRISSILLLLIAVTFSHAAGKEDYTIPGVETGEVMISIHVWGEVRSPGTHLVPFDADLIEGLSCAGGPTGSANLGDVRVVYNGYEINYDLDDFLHGEGDPVPVLQPGATIYIARQNFEWWKEAVDFSYKIIVAANLIWIMIER